jgi:hypothetical protein
MFGNGMNQKISFVGNAIHVDLLSVVDEFGDDHRVLWGHSGSCRQSILEVRFLPDDIHRGSREHIRRTKENWVSVIILRRRSPKDLFHSPYAVSECLGLF